MAPDNGTLKTRGPEMSGPFFGLACVDSRPGRPTVSVPAWRYILLIWSSRACRRTARPCRASLKAASNIRHWGVRNPGAPHVVRSEVHQVGPKGERDRYLAP
jgi:hypothetical protein